jgi:RHS repeat-associated protein
VGFGNLTNRVPSGTAPSSPATPADPATNRLTGYTYDNNGNAYLSGGQYYDAENRLIETNNFDTRYGYDSRNKRIWEGTYTYNGNGGYNQTAAQVFFYGLDGKKLGTYTTGIVYGGQGGVVPQSIAFNYASTNTYFAGRMVQQGGVTFIEDRLGSNGKYFPYGEERNYPALPNDQVKFATYTRDSATGLDYADQRYYSSSLARFVTPDPYRGSFDPSVPLSWNRYGYVLGDPVNGNDPNGLCGSQDDIDDHFDEGNQFCSDGADNGNGADAADNGGGYAGGEGGDGDPSNADYCPSIGGCTVSVTATGTADDGSDDNNTDDPGDPGDPGDPVDPGACTSAFTSAGQTLFGMFGIYVGSQVGVVVGGVAGTVVEPGGGTVIGGIGRGVVGGGIGGYAGYNAGGAVGGWLGNIFRSNSSGGGGRKGERRRTAKPDKPKHAWPDKNDPNRWWTRDPSDPGKRILKPPGWRPPGWSPNN